MDPMLTAMLLVGGGLGFVLAGYLSFVRLGLKPVVASFFTGFLGLVLGGVLSGILVVTIWPPFDLLTALVSFLLILGGTMMVIGKTRNGQEVRDNSLDGNGVSGANRSSGVGS